MKVVLASHNPGKLAELHALLTPLGWSVANAADLDVTPAPELRATFVENALDKARHAAQASGLPALADDSGLVVPALDGAPGIRSARFAGAGATDAANNALLVSSIAGLDKPPAYFFCALVLVRHPLDPAPVIACGRWHGRLLGAPRGSGGFGYDPLFWLPALGRTAAELSTDEKSRLSHRGRALTALLAELHESAATGARTP